MKNFLHIALTLTLIAIAAAGCTEIPQHTIEKEPDIKLEGYWKFSIGDDTSWAEPGYDDSGWEEVFVPAPWEDEGFHGYDGYAWYRKHITITREYEGTALYIDLGFVDDVDETYINGHRIGFSGSFPPNYVTAYFAQRKYVLPPNYINYGGENVISVRVYDAQLGGGITSGNVGIFQAKDIIIPQQMFTGTWKFKTGDDMDWKDSFYDDGDWDDIRVPGFWEQEGYRDYDGFGWYRKSFMLDEQLKNNKLVLLLGKVDDFDQVFINGVEVGSTGKWRDGEPVQPLEEYYKKNRVYYIPDGVINENGINHIAVRVYDGFVDGGIYEGYPGLITQEKYNEIRR